MTAPQPAPDTTTASWPPGLPRSLDYPAVPVGSILRAGVRRWGDRTAFIQHDRPITFTELGERAHAVAGWLADHGIGRGDVVALHIPNCLQYPALYFGIMLSGATFSPTNPLLPAADLAAQLTDAGATALITWDQVLPLVRPALAASPVTTVIVTGDVHARDFTARLDLADGDVDAADLLGGDPTDRHLDAAVDVDTDLAHLAYTGGTTGVSKGVEILHRNVVTNVLQSACWSNGALPELDEHGDVTVRQVCSAEEYPVPLGTVRIINLTPWFHAMGAVGYLNGMVLSGTTVVIHARFDPAAYVADMARYDVTSIGGAPPIFVALLQVPAFTEGDWSGVRGVSSGAAPLPVPLIEKLKATLPNAKIGEGYGLTEVTMMATSNPSFLSGTRKPGTVGVPVFDTEISIRSLETGEALPQGERGEVCIRGPQVMRGYAGRPEATAEVIDADGWFHTGDVGILDEDGYLAIVDRTKDMLIFKGYTVYPRELEEILFGVPGVAGAAVVGRPDEEAGELPVAYIVRKDDAAGAALTLESVLATVNDRVTHYKRLRDVVFIDAIPVSAAGKVLKRELAALEREKVGG
ncbi:AMP-binding protein [Blastococcus sp. TML/M2B]|uniref:AMP-binding protein n=1 Tax=unclassified Blastococcus TaxID=2619396 RepID=UPI00190A5F5E|nr:MULTISPECIES: AMP-binding protein [unclassified Blastococcus]MBN1091795.1 AMP-binding protein [Blastococcus sp. TML/M2B]MBN1094645.1 AMP-binding protein [Blastococcus sp. TML/C7B]